MECLFFWFNLLLGGLAFAVWIWVVALNWYWVWMGFSRRASASPILLMGPIFSVIAVACWVRSGFALDWVSPWVLVVALWVLDPGAIPLLLIGVWRRIFSRFFDRS